MFLGIVKYIRKITTPYLISIFICIFAIRNCRQGEKINLYINQCVVIVGLLRKARTCIYIGTG